LTYKHSTALELGQSLLPVKPWLAFKFGAVVEVAVAAPAQATQPVVVVVAITK
jgi:hypothetical protein